MKRLQALTLGVAIVLGVGLIYTSVSYAAIDPFGPCADPANSATTVCAGKDDQAGDLINTIINTMIFIVGLLSVVSIIASGIMYATSNGEAANITKAKNTMTYAIVGLVVALIAYALVNWVITLFIK